MKSGKIKLQQKFAGIFFLLLLLLNVYYVARWPLNLTGDMRSGYINLVIVSLIYTASALVLLKNGLDLLEPMTVVFAIHYILYVFAPINSILTGEIMHPAGVYVFDGCVKATWIAVLVFVCLQIGYNSNIKVAVKYSMPKKACKQQVLRIVYLLWIVGFFFTLIYLFMRGFSLKYMLTFGSQGKFNDDLAENSALSFFSVIGNLMFASWLYIYELSDKKILKWVMFAAMMLCLIMRGFRIFILILAVAPLIFNYLKKNKRPSIRFLVIASVVAIFLIGFIGWIRGPLRKNSLDTLDEFSMDDIVYAIVGNFDIYKTYYAVVRTVPGKIGYTWGAQMIWYTLLMFVPRAIWPGKPQPVSREILGCSVNAYAVKAGSAYPAIAEWYHEFGVIGCSAIAFLVGLILKNIWDNVRRNGTMNNLIFYSLFLPMLLQFIIRGYTPSNFWMLISMAVPVIIVEMFAGDYQREKCKI